MYPIPSAESSPDPNAPPEQEPMMGCELEHMLMTYSDHEVISEQGSLRDLLTCLRSLAEELQLDFEEALTQSGAAYQDRLVQALRPTRRRGGPSTRPASGRPGSVGI